MREKNMGNEHVSEFVPIVETPCGIVEGIYDEENKLNIFKGIRYAKAERFGYPKRITHWNGIYKADRFGAACYQEGAFVEPDRNNIYFKEFDIGPVHTYSEDCLFLNLWVPEKAENAPVLFFIHGGGYKTGYSYEKPFEGAAYCKKGVILVTVSYRVGPLGFLALPELKDENGHTGNYALFDLMEALVWVKDNIRSFGGDPDRITISGQSAGAMCVQLLCMSPLTDGFFNGAIMISGGGVSDNLRFSRSMESQFELGQVFMKRLGVNNGEEMKNIDLKDMYLEFGKMWRTLPDSGDFCVPAVDGWFLLEDEVTLARKGLQKNIPYMIGSTSEDILPDMLKSMAEEWADIQIKQGKTPSYVYYFSRQLPGDENGAWHSADLWYIFGSLEKCWRPFTDRDYEISESFVTYIADFVKTGNPNGMNLLQWIPYGDGHKQSMNFGDRQTGMR